MGDMDDRSSSEDEKVGGIEVAGRERMCIPFECNEGVDGGYESDRPSAMGVCEQFAR